MIDFALKEKTIVSVKTGGDLILVSTVEHG